jgi:diguanylate cyclase (GGDEF)-like protein/PAS domain S-box-containing protein
MMIPSYVAKGLGQNRAALVVLVLGLAISFVAWRVTEHWIAADAASQFQQETARAGEAIDRRIHDNFNILIGLKGLYNASEDVTRQEFRLYLSGFNLERRYSGVRVVSYIQRVTQAEKAAFVREVRRDTSIDPRGHPDFAIKPQGEREEYVVVKYMQPLEGNEAGFGLDLLAEPVRRADIVRIRDSGEFVASPPFAAAVDPNQISITVRTAIYRRGLPVQTVAQRREAFQGVVSVVIHINEMLGGLLGAQLGSRFDLAIHDLGLSAADRPETPSKRSLLFESLGPSGAKPEDAHNGMNRVATLDVGGRKWQLSFSSPSGARGIERVLPTVMLLAGIVTSLLLFWLVWTLSVSRARALALAEHAIVASAAEMLREQLSFIQQLIEAVPQPIFFKDAEGHYLGVNAAWEKFFGIPRKQFIGKSVFELYPDDRALAERHHARDQELFSRPGSQSYEAAIAAADGKVHHTIYNKATFNKADGSVAGLIGTITDVSGLKEAEAALRKSEERFRDLTELSSDWYWEQDADFRFTEVSSNVRKAGLDAGENIGKTRWDVERVHMTEEERNAHQKMLEAHQPFQNVVYQRSDADGNLHTISISGRPIFDEEGRFTGYRGTGTDITEQKQVENQIRHMAHHDALTGLPNRILLHDRIGQAIAQARRGGSVAAILVIDLDRFKNVNDSLGHQVGDGLLRSVAERLVGCVRGTDTVARMGGDEFVVVLVELRHAEDAGQVARKMLAALPRPINIDGHELRVTTSIGICAYPHDGEDAETLMRNADAAMYHAKETGRNNFQFFTRQMNIAANQRLLLEKDLRLALERKEFTLYYQPQLDLKTGDIVGFEALIRWPHVQRGMVVPMAFIPLAEETGLIGPIGEWALHRACTQARGWQALGYPQLQVSVNCSAQQFRLEGLVDMVARTLRETGLSASSLELELTESIIVEHTEHVMARFKALDEIGVKLSIDDFGTGYSSLGYLKRFPIHELKIDQSFVRDISSDPDDAAIVSAIIAMAHGLGLRVVAEGVETTEQLAFLRKLGCDRAQGYYFSRPLPAEEIEPFLRNWKSQPLLARA